MNTKLFSQSWAKTFRLPLLRSLLLLLNGAALGVYIFMRSLLYEFPFELSEELTFGAQLIGMASAFALVVYALALLADGLEYLIVRRRNLYLSTGDKATFAALFVLIGVLYMQGII